jgi:hypothetical protein
VELRVRDITIKNSISVERLLEIFENSGSIIIHGGLSVFYGIFSIHRVHFEFEKVKRIWSRGKHNLQAPCSARPPRLTTSKLHKVGAPRPLLEPYIVTCRGFVRDLKDGALNWMIVFIDTLYTQLGTIGNYSATAISTHFTVHRHTRIRVVSLH